MSDKKYFFMCGLPRSGNTLISSILNQNPDINVSANSIVPQIFDNTLDLYNHQVVQNFPDFDSLNNFFSSIFDSYYKNWSGKYIIDRGGWGIPKNLYCLENYLKNEIKIICPVRDLLEIVESLKKFDIVFSDSQNFKSLYLDDDSLIYERIFEEFDILAISYWSIKNLCNDQYRNYVHFIEYNDLILNPKTEIEKIYDFLKIPSYAHDFDNIDQFKMNNISYNDEIWNAKDLHKLKSKIEKSSTNINNIPEKIKQKYSNLEIWRT
jgi:sulfotransferase